jgi:hypothetical protein
MISTSLQIRLAVIVTACFCQSALAENADLQLLEQKLQQRDMVISELLERVEALEHRIGIQRAARDNGLSDEPVVASSQKVVAAGSAASPGRVVVSKDDAERALERSLSRDGALLLRPGVVEIEPSLSFIRQEDSTPTLVNSGSTVFAGETKRNTNAVSADLALRAGLPWDSQLEVGVPYRWREVENVTRVGFSSVDSTSASAAGAGDLRIGLAKTLLREGLWRPDLVGRLTWNTGSGEASKGGVSLGGGVQSFTGSLAAIKRQDPVAFVGGLSYQYSLEEDRVQLGGTTSVSFGSYIALSPQTSLQLTLSAGYQEDTKLSGRTIQGSDRVLGTLVIGGSTLVVPGTLLNLSVGVGLTDDSNDFTVTLSLPSRLD